MNVGTATKLYVSKMLENTGKGMKVFLLGKETLSLISMTYAQSDLLKEEVYLFERIDNQSRENMKHMKCITFLRPTAHNVELLIKELKNPRYGAYYIYFSNILERGDIKRLAEADDGESVKELQEFYADYIPVLDHAFTLNLTAIARRGTLWEMPAKKRTADALISILLSLKKLPVIRYSTKSDLAKRLAEQVLDIVKNNGTIFDFRRTETPLLMILDRRDDPVTPLLNQWTYQAMVHELLGISNNRVDLSEVPGISKDMREVVMSPDQDDFLKDTLYSDFGEIGLKIKNLVDQFQHKQHSTAQINSISDMKKFVDNYPQFKKMSGTVAKHVAIVGELSRIVADHNLMEVSEVEQQMTTQSGHSEVVSKLQHILRDSNVRENDMVRLVLLYCLCYEGQSGYNPAFIVELLKSRGVSDSKCKLVQQVMNYSGGAVRGGQLFGEQTAVAMTKKLFKGLQGVENVYTQHKPYILDVLQQLTQHKLKESDYAWLGGAPLPRVSEVILFIVGGITYEEVKAVHNWNITNPGCKVILGSTAVHNTQSFLEAIVSNSA